MRHSTTIYLPGDLSSPTPEIRGQMQDSGYAYLVLDPGSVLDEIMIQFNTGDPRGRAALLRVRDEINALVALMELDEEDDIYDGATPEEAQEIAATREETTR